MSKELFLWTEKYRPATIKDCILPNRIKNPISDMISKGEIQSMLFSGNPGVGKSALAKSIAKDLGAEILTINGSENRNIDMLRTTVTQFVTSASFTNKTKIVLIDEADYLNRQSTQPALRNFIEEFSKSSRFIFTANHPQLIFDALKSRMVTFDFNMSKEEQKEVITHWGERVKWILAKEGIEYSKRVLNQVILKYFPDYRKTLNELQKNCSSGKLDAVILQTFGDSGVEDLIKHLKDNSFSGARKWIADNPQESYTQVMTSLWKKVDSFVENKDVPQFVLLANKYAISDTQVTDTSINLLAFLTELMIECEFK